jgi:hypothetical protein
MEERHAAAVQGEAESKERMARLHQSLAGGFQHATRLGQLRKQQAALNEELQAGKGETMAVGEVVPGE